MKQTQPFQGKWWNAGTIEMETNVNETIACSKYVLNALDIFHFIISLEDYAQQLGAVGKILKVEGVCVCLYYLWESRYSFWL